jgi:hypothetical protein
MQRTGQRAIARGDRHEEVRARRGDDARREGRGVHAVVRDGDEIGVQRPRLGIRRQRAAKHAQRIGGVRKVRVRPHRRFAARGADNGGGDHRHGADDDGFRLQPATRPEAGNGCTEGGHHRHSRGRGEQRGQHVEGHQPRRRKCGAHMLRVALDTIRQRP